MTTELEPEAQAILRRALQRLRDAYLEQHGRPPYLIEVVRTLQFVLPGTPRANLADPAGIGSATLRITRSRRPPAARR